MFNCWFNGLIAGLESLPYIFLCFFDFVDGLIRDRLPQKYTS